MNYSDLTKAGKFFLIAGPCVVESKEVCFETAETLAAVSRELGIPFIFKASYKKANRSSITSFTGIKEIEALDILAEVRSKYNVPILTDIHESSDAEKIKDIADVIQIPAFLFRQTDLLIAAGKTGKIVNIKKGQFASADMMRFAAEKVASTGNTNILLTERGTMFGYHDLVSDFRNIQDMKSFGYPVIFDATHSVQQPNGTAGSSGGQPQYIETLAKCAIAAGADGLFIETHPDPVKALSDGANMIRLDSVKSLLQKLLRLKAAI